MRMFFRSGPQEVSVHNEKKNKVVAFATRNDTFFLLDFHVIYCVLLLHMFYGS